MRSAGQGVAVQGELRRGIEAGEREIDALVRAEIGGRVEAATETNRAGELATEQWRQIARHFGSHARRRTIERREFPRTAKPNDVHEERKILPSLRVEVLNDDRFADLLAAGLVGANGDFDATEGSLIGRQRVAFGFVVD